MQFSKKDERKILAAIELLDAIPKPPAPARELAAREAARLICEGNHIAIIGTVARGMGHRQFLNVLASLFGSELAFCVVTPAYNPGLAQPIIEPALEGRDRQLSEKVYADMFVA